MKNKLLPILKYTTDFKKSFILGILLAFLASVLKMMAPDNIRQIMDYLQDNVDGTYDFGIVKRYAIIAGAFMVSSFVLNSMQSVILSTASLKMARLMKNKVNEKLDRLPISFFISKPAGDIQSRITNDVESISTAISNNLASIVTAITTLVVCLFMMLKTNVILTGVALLNSVVGLIITIFIIKKSTPFAVKQQVLMGAVNSEVYESFSGHLVIKAFNCEKDVIEHFENTNSELTENGWKASFFQSITMPIMMMISNMGYIVIAVTGTILILNHVANTTIGDLLVFILYSINEQFNS